MQPTIKQFGREEIAVLRTEMQSALDNIKTKYGLSELILGNITFTSNSLTAKMKARTQNSPDIFSSDDEFKFFSLQHGLPDKLIGCQFKSEGLNYTIIRIETRNSKYPVIAQCKETRKSYKFSVPRIKDLLEKTEFTPYTIIK